MREHRIKRIDFIQSVFPPWFQETLLKQSLEDAGFDLKKEIIRDEDVFTGEVIFRQKETAKNV